MAQWIKIRPEANLVPKVAGSETQRGSATCSENRTLSSDREGNRNVQ